MTRFPVVRDLADAPRLAPRASAITLGVFDGLHRGHRSIIEELLSRRAADDVEQAFLLTFDPHPVVVTHSRETPPILSTIDERLELLSAFDLDGVFVIPFDTTVQHMDYREFIQRYFVDALCMRELVLGYDCHFGHRREGNPERVREEGKRNGFRVTIVPPVVDHGGVISSSTIRSLLQASKLDHANALLGHPYLVRGVVGPGQGKGADLGFPTANVRVSDPLKLWPPCGVYAVRVGWRDRFYDGMMNVGRAPTIKDGDPEIEVHLFDFGNTLYGETVSVHCVKWLREEQRFPSIAALITQLATDRTAAMAALAV